MYVSVRAYVHICDCSFLSVCVLSLLPSTMMSAWSVNNNKKKKKKSFFFTKQRWEGTCGSYVHHKLCTHTLLLGVFVGYRLLLHKEA